MLRVLLDDTNETTDGRVTYNGEVLTGVTVENFPDGTLLAETYYTSGVQDGPERQFTHDGRLIAENIYDFGFTVQEREWYSNGRLAREKHLRNGRVVSEQRWDENGDPMG
ncbi:hypothetical protein ABZ897_03335 [Nonomuraea sp. NPDC046802]|uniref:toxin-antitoxin system YwqK family antitoxin n=1 Tax=Nonomuraea sp. NPDC046802 TaxID=3154919 RepID=UPI0033FEB8AA